MGKRREEKGKGEGEAKMKRKMRWILGDVISPNPPSLFFFFIFTFHWLNLDLPPSCSQRSSCAWGMVSLSRAVTIAAVG